MSRPTVLLFALGALFTACSQPTAVEFGTVERRTILARVSVSGEIQPYVEVPIAPDVSGEIVELNVEEGQFVQKGALLFVIRPESLESALEQAQAAYNSAQADYANAQAAVTQAKATLVQDSVNLARNRTLFEQKAISKADFEQFQLRYNLSLSAITSAEQTQQAAYYRIQSAAASVRQAAESLRQTRVYATQDGTVTNLNIKLGQRVVGTNLMSGTEALKIADLTRMVVEVEVNENDIVRLRVGDTATVEVDAFRELNRTFTGEVIEIGFSPTGTGTDLSAVNTADKVTTYPVKVLIQPKSYLNDKDLMRGVPQTAGPFRPGMSGVVNIFTGRAENVLAVPIQAVTVDRTDETATDPPRVVFTVPEGTDTVRMVPVKTGISDDDYIEIKTGLQAGQRIVVGPYRTVTKALQTGTQVMEASEAETEAPEAD